MPLHLFRKLRTDWKILQLFLLVPLLVSCARGPVSLLPHARPSGDEVMIMSYNLRLYAYTDRDDDGQPDDFKPESEINRLVSIISQSNPDVLVIQEIGAIDALEDLQNRLSQSGVNYPHIDYLGQEGSFANLAILSRRPILSSDPVTNLSFTIKGEQYPVLRGFQQVDIQVGSEFVVTLINVHLKSKLFHPAGQTDMRRNESRLLATHVRRLLRTNPERNLIVCGDFNDTVHSSSMRNLIDGDDAELIDLILKDPYDQVWTHFYRYEQTYSRIDYLLVNRSMLRKWVIKKSGILHAPLMYGASDHRPIYATFRAF